MVSVVHAKKENVAKFGPGVLERVVLFARKYHPEANEEILVGFCLGQMYAENPTALTLAVFDDDKRLWGHALFVLEEHFGSPHVTIVQLELDHENGGQHPKNRAGAYRDGMKILDDWTKSLGCSCQMLYAANDKVADIFEKYGAKRTGRVLMKRTIER